MKKRICSIGLIFALFCTACGQTAASSTAASSAASASESTATSGTDTLDSLADWQACVPQQKAEYNIGEPHESQFDHAVMPEPREFIIRKLWSGDRGTLADAAEAYGLTLEELQSMNPDLSDADLWNENGNPRDQSLIVQQDFTFEASEVKTVTITTPWVVSRFDRVNSFDVPSGLDDQAAIVLAEAFEFLPHCMVSCGYYPSEPVPGKELLERPTEGARFTKYSDLKQYLEAVFTPDLVEYYSNGGEHIGEIDHAKGYRGTFLQGENDELWFTPADRGGYIKHCGSAYTEPQLQADGSLTFWQVGLYAGDDFDGWGGEEPVVIREAELLPVKLVPSESGWRVAELSLAY